ATGSSTIGSASFTFTNGVLNGSGTVTVTSATVWSGGTMSGAGATNLLGSSTLSSGFILDTRTLNNAGTVADTVFRSVFGGAVINNQSGGTWDLQGAVGFNGAGAFNNAGALTKSGAGTAIMALPLNNTGSVSVQ